jgi:hypothetical protein
LTLVAAALFALRDRKRLFWSTLAFALTGTLAAWAVSHAVPMFYRRLLIWTGPPWFLLIGVGIAGLPRKLAAFVALVMATLLLPGLADYYARDTKPKWRPLIQKLSDDSNPNSVILSAHAERFLTYYYERVTNPLPARSYQRVKSEDFERYVKNVDEFYVVAQAQEVDFRNLEARIRATRRYKMLWTERHQNAILIKYRARSTNKHP